MWSGTRAALLAWSAVGCGQLDGVARPAPDASAVDAGPVDPRLDDAMPPLDGVACATPRIETWAGTASRAHEYYPDDITATVTWARVGSSGCVDRYAPSGTARYAFAIPGALCRQSVAPEVEAITATDGVLTIDRGRSPATFVGHAATTWPVTWSCDLADGTTATQQFAAGGLWFEAAGEVGAAGIVGTWTEPDGAACGRGQSALPCVYAWHLVPLR